MPNIPNDEKNRLKVEIKRLQKEWGTLTDLLGRLRQDYLVEVNQKRKIDLEGQIEETIEQRIQVEGDLITKERKFSEDFPNNTDDVVVHWLFVTSTLWQHFSLVLKFSKDIHNKFQLLELSHIKPLYKTLNDVDFSLKNKSYDFSKRFIEKEIGGIKQEIFNIKAWSTRNHFLTFECKDSLETKFKSLDNSMKVLLKDSWSGSIISMKSVQEYNNSLKIYLIITLLGEEVFGVIMHK